MRKIVGLSVFLLVIVIFALSSNQANALCCFPYSVNYYIDPVTGDFVLNGELTNDSYREEPFGHTGYRFIFLDKDNNTILERNVMLTDILPMKGGVIIPFIATFPFQVVLNDIDAKTAQQINSFRVDGTNTLDYFGWKPADLVVSSNEITNVGTIHGKSGDVFTKWKIGGNITNTNSEKTENVYVVASLRDKNDSMVGVAGYSDDSVQPVTLKGFETKDFVLYALVPTSKIPSKANLYAESDDSSMVFPYYKPIIVRDATNRAEKNTADPKKPIVIFANLTNISRENLDFNWIIQIKKSPKSVSEGDVTEYHESKIAFITAIHGHIDAQKSAKLKYSWIPQSNGVYFYEMYVWDSSNATSLSYPFRQSFLSDNWLIANSNLNSVTNQIKSGIALDKIQCGDSLNLAHKASNGNLVCIKSDTKSKLIERGWIDKGDVSECKDSPWNCSGLMPDDLTGCDKIAELKMEIWHCPMITTPTDFEMLKTEGFAMCEKNGNQYYSLRGGQQGSFTYQIRRGIDSNDPPLTSSQVEVIKEPDFVCEYDNGTRKTCSPAEVHVDYEPKSVVLGFNSTATISANISVDESSESRSFWLGLTPYSCFGGSYERFATIKSDAPSHQREITILSISPQNVTLPEPKEQTPKTVCNKNGVCFTPE